MNNYTLNTADRLTHIKIVAVSLVAAIAIVAVGINGRIDRSNTATAGIRTDGPVVRAGKSTTITANDNLRVR